MAKLNLTKEDMERISSAVTEAEKNTSGEIATALIKESDDYATNELLFAIIAGFVYFFVFTLFYSSIESCIRSYFWEYKPVFGLMAGGFSTFIVIALAYFGANLDFIDRLIISKKTMVKKVNERAVRHFVESGVYKTKDRTGILIFISLLEQRVELLADSGISEKIAQNQWDSIVANIIEGVRNGKFTEHLVGSIKDCGRLLSEHFPIEPDDENELKNDMEILED